MLKDIARDYEMKHLDTHEVYDWYSSDGFEIIKNYMFEKYPELVELYNTITSINEPENRVKKAQELKQYYSDSYNIEVIPLQNSMIK